MSDKFKNIQLYDILFYLTDDDGNELLNDDYTAKLFKLKDVDFDNAVKKDYRNDFSYIVESFQFSDLEEVSDE